MKENFNNAVYQDEEMSSAQKIELFARLLHRLSKTNLGKFQKIIAGRKDRNALVYNFRAACNERIVIERRKINEQKSLFCRNDFNF